MGVSPPKKVQKILATLIDEHNLVVWCWLSIFFDNKSPGFNETYVYVIVEIEK